MDNFWEEMLQRYNEGEKIWTRTTQERSLEQFGCVPPAAQKHNAFLVGEPYTHNSRGEEVYACFRLKDGIYSARYMTLREFQSS